MLSALLDKRFWIFGCHCYPFVCHLWDIEAVVTDLSVCKSENYFLYLATMAWNIVIAPQFPMQETNKSTENHRTFLSRAVKCRKQLSAPAGWPGISDSSCLPGSCSTYDLRRAYFWPPGWGTKMGSSLDAVMRRTKAPLALKHTFCN